MFGQALPQKFEGALIQIATGTREGPQKVWSVLQISSYFIVSNALNMLFRGATLHKPATSGIPSGLPLILTELQRVWHDFHNKTIGGRISQDRVSSGCWAVTDCVHFLFNAPSRSICLTDSEPSKRAISSWKRTDAVSLSSYSPGVRLRFPVVKCEHPCKHLVGVHLELTSSGYPDSGLVSRGVVILGSQRRQVNLAERQRLEIIVEAQCSEHGEELVRAILWRLCRWKETKLWSVANVLPNNSPVHRRAVVTLDEGL